MFKEDYCNIIFNERRVFIDIAISGCSYGCKYCYVSSKSLKQKLHNKDEFLSSLSFIENSDKFIKGKNGTLISLCPNTEPFMSELSSSYIYLVLDKFLPYGNPIQISTKSNIPDNIFNIIIFNRKYRSQVIIFISIVTLSAIFEMEPNAKDINCRIENISNLKKNNILCCLYIKPILAKTVQDLELFTTLIKEYRPDYICIGVYYKKEIEHTNKNDIVYLHHPAHNKYVSIGLQNSEVEKFVRHINSLLPLKVFHSSICVVAHAIDALPSSKIWLMHNELCIKCRSCEVIFES